MDFVSTETLGKVYYFISKYRERYDAYPNTQSSYWNYIPDLDSELEFDLDLNMNHPNPRIPSLEWQKSCDEYIEKYHVNSEFMDEMTFQLLEIYLNIIPFKIDTNRRKPNTYDLTETEISGNIQAIQSESVVSLYLKNDLNFLDKIPEVIDAELAEHFSSLEHWSIDLDELEDLDSLAQTLQEFLQKNDPEFYDNLQEGDGIFFGDYYRNDGYFFFDGKGIVPISHEEIPGIHDYGIPPKNIRKYYPFTWSTYGFLNSL